MQVFAKFLIVCEKYTIPNHLIALEHTATKPVGFLTNFSKIFEVRYIYPNPRC